jgi:membrane associated rhomboid family serine protease
MTKIHNETKRKLTLVVSFVVCLWIVYSVSFVIPSMNNWGVIPRSPSGLPGIFTMHFLHGSLGHLMSNSIPLLILLMLLTLARHDAIRIAIVIAIASAGLLWIVGRNATHIGASVLVFGLISFLIASGYVERRFLDVVLAVVVLFFFGGSLLWGIVPSFGGIVSWDGHLCGVIAGTCLAFLNPRSPEPHVAVQHK